MYSPSQWMTWSLGPRITAVEIEGSHDLAGDNPGALVKTVRDFLDANDL